MEHKAFVFDYERFSEELRPLIESALRTGSAKDLKSFISNNKSELVDPCEGQPLTDEWEDAIEFHDIDTYADFCLTKYYNPVEDCGLGHDWGLPINAPGLGNILGEPVQINGNCFDPGKMGSYFSSLSVIKKWMSFLNDPKVVDSVDSEKLGRVKALFSRAEARNLGLYVTF